MSGYELRSAFDLQERGREAKVVTAFRVAAEALLRWLTFSLAPGRLIAAHELLHTPHGYINRRRRSRLAPAETTIEKRVATARALVWIY